MKRFAGVLLACDFDNTIAPTGKCFAQRRPFTGIPEENLAAIRRFMAEGGLFSVVTGRAYPAYLHLKDQVPGNCPTALFNGAGIFDFSRNEYLWRVRLPEDVLLRYHEVMDAFPALGLEAFTWDERVFALRPNDFVRRHQELTKAPWVEVASLEETGAELSKLLFEGESELLTEVERFLRSRLWIGAYETIFSSPNLLELTAKGATKADAVRQLARLSGVAPERVYCAGDEENDLPMLEIAAEAFIPADCNPRLLGRGFTTVGPCTEHAVADIIAALEARYPER